LTHEERVERMKEFKKTLDGMIMMCDNRDDLLALASVLMTVGKRLLIQEIGLKGTIELFNYIEEELRNG
jgi:hypothetical protein